MRITVLALALVATPALAQSDADRAAEIIGASIALGGFPEEVNTLMTACFTDRLTETDIAAFIAAGDDTDALQAATQGMDAYDEVILCVAQTVGAAE